MMVWLGGWDLHVTLDGWEGEVAMQRYAWPANVSFYGRFRVVHLGRRWHTRVLLS